MLLVDVLRLILLQEVILRQASISLYAKLHEEVLLAIGGLGLSLGLRKRLLLLLNDLTL